MRMPFLQQISDKGRTEPLGTEEVRGDGWGRGAGWRNDPMYAHVNK
jgi:hypothetical protein